MLIVPKLTIAWFFLFASWSKQGEPRYLIYLICFALLSSIALLLKKHATDKAKWHKEKAKLTGGLAQAVTDFDLSPIAEEPDDFVKEDKFFDTLLSHIVARIADPQLSVEELSKAIGLSRSTLYKKLKSKTGYVPNEFIRVVRLKHAAALLSSSEYNISEISYMVGFNSHSYFSKCFVQQFNVTPTEFAESHRREGLLSLA